jgi:NADH dehydrogenase/NADH:ubiquinone oxidoreductase subunit G
MTRCIHCTRCVRFLTEVGGISDFGVIGRGFFMEIGTFIENHLYNDLFSILLIYVLWVL